MRGNLPNDNKTLNVNNKQQHDPVGGGDDFIASTQKSINLN